ncbi:Arabinose operon regulatory protein [Vibrio mangrovi]|nr:Arabinose operon regulatory protein [Vibrio mangrovi]
MEVATFKGKVMPGECVAVKAGEVHYFAAETEAKFVVADLERLPEPIMTSGTVVFSITSPLLRYLSFIEEQLKYQVNTDIEKLMYDTFYALMCAQQVLKQFDHRIRNAMEYIDAHLSQPLSNTQLATIAYLSPTQFKKVFKQQTNLTVTQYITKLRMEKAQALLLHTDYPIQIVAETVGYTNLTAFSRRFSQYVGLPPSKYAR